MWYMCTKVSPRHSVPLASTVLLYFGKEVRVRISETKALISKREIT